jgi:uncharacterized protein (DUF169 family)
LFGQAIIVARMLARYFLEALMPLGYAEMEKILMEELRLYHHPIAVTWLFTDADVEMFKAKTSHVTPVKPLTFCQWEIAARMQGKTVLADRENLGCANARVSFGWKNIDEKEIQSQNKYCVDPDQAERFLRSKPCMPPDSLKAIAVGPLGKAALAPHVVHFYCDNMQSYHLAVDYMAATDTHPLRPQITMSSSACGGSVFTWNENTFNCCPACSGSYNAGKTERGEVNVFIPGGQIEAVVRRLLQRIEKSGSSSITRPGDPFPGGDICKNCPQIVFKAELPRHAGIET